MRVSLWAVCLLLSACVQSLPVPEDPAISCENDRSCLEGFVCNPRTARCVPAGSVIDTESPVIVTANAANEFTVDLVFSEPVLPDIALEASEIRVVPELEILARTLSSDGQTLQLITDEQQSGEPYQLTVLELADLNGNSVSDVATTFTGGGELPDRTPPELLSPNPDERLFATRVTLTWTPRRKAKRYTVELSLQSDFATLERTVDVEQPLVRLDGLAPVTHFWRVRADVTAPEAELVARRFDLMDSAALYVWCPADGPCARTGHAGNLSDPHQSIQTALQDAAAHGVPEVRIAVRGQDAPYEEQIALESGVSVRGGYSANDFSSSPTEVATIRGGGGAVVIGQFVQGPLTVERLRLENLASSLPSAVALSVVASQGITFQEVQLSGPSGIGDTGAAVIETSTDIVFRDSILSAPAASASSAGLRARFSSVRFERTNMSAGAAPVSEAVQARDSALEFVASSLESGEASDRSIVIDASATTLSIEDSSLVAGPTDPFSSSEFAGSYGLYATAEVVEGVNRPPATVDVQVHDSTIVAGSGPSSIGMWLLNGRALIEDNAIQTGSASVPWDSLDELDSVFSSPNAPSIGILLDGKGDWRVIDNTVEAGPATGWAAFRFSSRTRCETAVVSAAVCLTGSDISAAPSCRAEFRRNRLAASSAVDTSAIIVNVGLAAYSAGVVSFFNPCELWALNNISVAGTALGVFSSALSAGLLLGDLPGAPNVSGTGSPRLMSSNNVFLGGSATLTPRVPPPTDDQRAGLSGGVLIFNESIAYQTQDDPDDPGSIRDADDGAFAFVNNIIGTIETEAGNSQPRIAFSICEGCPELPDPRFRIEKNLLVNVAENSDTALYRYFAGADSAVEKTRLDKDTDAILLQNLVLDDNPANFDGVFTAFDGTVSPASNFTPAAGSILIDAGINLYDPATFILDIAGTERPSCGATPCNSPTPAWEVGPIELPP